MTTTYTTEQTARQEALWADVDAALAHATSIAWNGCHKVYVLLDDEQTTQMRDLGYGDGTDDSVLITSVQATPAEMSAHVRDWFAQSCGLRFIGLVTTGDDQKTPEYENLIAQCEEAFLPATED